jgi:hypothetical protein
MPNIFDKCLITDVTRQLQTSTEEEMCDHTYTDRNENVCTED